MRGSTGKVKPFRYLHTTRVVYLACAKGVLIVRVAESGRLMLVGHACRLEMRDRLDTKTIRWWNSFTLRKKAAPKGGLDINIRLRT